MFFTEPSLRESKSLLVKELTKYFQSKEKPHSGQCKPDETRTTVNAIINNACDEAACCGREPAPRVYNRALISLKNQGLHFASNNVPEFRQVKSRIYRKRNKMEQVKKITRKRLTKSRFPGLFWTFYSPITNKRI